MSLPDLEVVVVAGRRPDLLGPTLASFQSHLFRHFNVVRVQVNIDPFGGDEAAHLQCRDLVSAQFECPVLHEPTTAGFTAAVRRLWSGVQTERVFHLEDDWLANEDVTPERVAALGQGGVASVALQCKEHGWTQQTTRMVRKNRRRILGLPIGGPPVPVFGTSPRFLTGAFARGCAQRMDLRLDPEKQMRDNLNPALCTYIAGFASEILLGQNGGMLITDIGRAWRDERNLQKVVSRGVSKWVQGDDKA